MHTAGPYLSGLIEVLVVGDGFLQCNVPTAPLLTEPVVLVKQALQNLLHVPRASHKLRRDTGSMCVCMSVLVCVCVYLCCICV